MLILHVEDLVFEFQDGWNASKCDDWVFYKQKFERMGNGIKCLDILAISPEKVAYLIEAKDYRIHNRTKPSDIIDEVCAKLLCTLAMLLPAKLNAAEPSERHLCEQVLDAKEILIVLHIELPPPRSRLDVIKKDPSLIRMKMRERFSPIGRYAKVASMEQMSGLNWTVRDSVS